MKNKANKGNMVKKTYSTVNYMLKLNLHIWRVFCMRDVHLNMRSKQSSFRSS